MIALLLHAALCLGAPSFALPPEGQQDLAFADSILEKGDKLLEEAKAAYEEARSKSSVSAFVDAGFKLEEARIKFIVLQEIGSPDKQKIAADRMRAVNQLSKLIHDGKVAISGTAVGPATPASAEPAKVDAPAVLPEPAKPPVDVSKRASVPDAARQKEAEKLLRDLYKDQYAKKAPADRQTLLKTLVEQAGRSGDDLVSAWVLHREIQDVAAQVVDVRTAMASVDSVARQFDVDALQLKVGVLAAMGKTAKLPGEFAALAEQHLKVADDLVSIDQYVEAEKSVSAALAHARKGNNVPLTARATTRARELTEAKTRYQGLKGTLATLAKTPDDPAANLDMGQYLCYVKGSWDLGVRFLAKGSDPVLKALAEKEIAIPTEAADLAALADGWGELADKDKSPLRKGQILAHAGQLYAAALPGSSGLLRAKIEKRLGDLEKAGPGGGPLNLLALIDVGQDTVAGTWTATPRGLLNSQPLLRSAVQIPYLPPAEYDLTLVVERMESKEALIIGLVGGGSQFIMVIDGWSASGGISGLCMLDGKWANDQDAPWKGPLLKSNAPSTIVCSIRREGVRITVGSQKVIDWKGDYVRLSQSPEHAVPNPQALFLGCNKSRILFSKIQLTPVSGEGKRLR